MKNRLLFYVWVASLALYPIVASAQYQVLSGTFGNGGGTAAGDHTVYCTAGQPIIGMTFDPSNIVKAGFWYAAGISSTVDVAITTFFGELRDDAIMLDWTVTASSSFEGFNVYRAAGPEDAFVRINAELIPASGSHGYRDDTALPGRTYRYRIGAISGTTEWQSQDISIAVPQRPTTLYQNYPNPFNPMTAIAFYVPSPQTVSLVVYSVAGQRVRTLMDGQQPAGRNTIRWDGRNDSGSRVGSGVYYYRLKAGKDVITKKLVIVR